MCNPYSGGRHSRHNYNTKIKPILERAQYKITYTGEFGERIDGDFSIVFI
jgi:hypothetical protein